jgi:starvation-inducible DNA-binding protein
MTQAAAQLSLSAKEAICDALNQGVAETAVTTMLAQNFHWNVTGMAFGPLHGLFQTIYEDHFSAQDDLAERIKALGGHAEGRLAGMLHRSKIAEHDGHASAEQMIATMLAAQEVLAQTMSGIASVAEAHGDLLTQDVAIGRGRAHDKFAWMLRAHIA